jgi:hypothetical protein
MQEYVDLLDKWVIFNQNGMKIKSGLEIHFCVSRNKWYVGYGRKGHKDTHYGIGDTIEEAFQDKIHKVNS